MNDGDNQELAMRLDSWILCQTAQPVDSGAVTNPVQNHVDRNGSLAQDAEVWQFPKGPVNQERARSASPHPIPLSDTFQTLSVDAWGDDAADVEDNDSVASERSLPRKAQKLREEDNEHLMQDAPPLGKSSEGEGRDRTSPDAALDHSSLHRSSSPMDVEDAPSRAHKSSLRTVEDFRLRGSSIAQLAQLLLRPNRDELSSLNAEALIALISVNGARRRQGDRKLQFVESLLAWLIDHLRTHLRLLIGIHRAKLPRTIATRRPSLQKATLCMPLKTNEHPSTLPDGSSRPSVPLELDTFSLFLRHVGNVLHAAVKLGLETRTAEVPKNVFIALGQLAEAVLPELETFSATFGAIRTLVPPLAPPKGSSLAPGTWATIVKTPRSGTPGFAGSLSNRCDADDTHTAPPIRNQEWHLNRSLILEPLNNEQRCAKINSPSFARELEDFIRHHYTFGPGRLIELVRRTRRGGYQVQFFSSYFIRAREALKDNDISLNTFGKWKVYQRPSQPSSRDMMSVVILRIPLSMSTSDFTEEFCSCNASRFSGFDSNSLRSTLHSVLRLSQRKVSSSGASAWVPSSSIRCIVDRKLGEALLAHGSLVVGFQSVDVRDYHPPVRICYHYVYEGHLARFCRSPPHCRHCDGPHPLRDCPHRLPSSSSFRADGPSSRSGVLSGDTLHGSEGNDPSP